MNAFATDSGLFGPGNAPAPAEDLTRSFDVVRQRFSRLEKKLEIIVDTIAAFDFDVNEDGSLVFVDEGGLNVSAFAPSTWMEVTEVTR